MGSIFPSTPPKQRFSHHQAAYLKSRTPNGKHVVKRELQMQIELCKWIRDTFPGLHFRSDTGSGAFNSQYEKDTHNRQQSALGLPDMTIFAARHGFHALCLELKPAGTELRMKRNGRIARVYKNSRGKIVHRDSAPRKIGDWKDYHLERQHQRHVELRQAGYCAAFVVGIEQAKNMICWYMGIPYENVELITDEEF